MATKPPTSLEMLVSLGISSINFNEFQPCFFFVPEVNDVNWALKFYYTSLYWDYLQFQAPI